jgi:endonuclease-8
VPEGPEIRRAADRVAAVLEGKLVSRVEFRLPELVRFESRLTGSAVTAIETRGKAMLTRFANGLTLYSHNQLYGRWYTVRRPKLPKTSRSLRVALHTESHSALLYSASDIQVLTDDQLLRHPFLQRLGPDILDRDLTEEQIQSRLAAQEFRNRALGSLYLDQGFLAGNGNYLRSEILWFAGIHPKAKPAALSASALARLARETLRISRRSYRTRGVTVPPAMASALKDGGETYGDYRFAVFGRDGLPCRRCQTTIERHVMSSRNLFVCPGCQPADGLPRNTPGTAL